MILVNVMTEVLKEKNYVDFIQVLSKEDTDTLNLCKKMMERGEWPPLLVVYDTTEG